jgi:hypothetical protein
MLVREGEPSALNLGRAGIGVRSREGESAVAILGEILRAGDDTADH